MGGSPDQQEASPYEYALADMATQKHTFDRNNLRPLSKVLMRRTKQEREPWRMERAVGQGISGALGSITPQVQQGTRSLLATPGVSPNSGAFVGRQGAMSTGTALAAGQAGVDANWGQDNRYIQGLQNITRIGTRQAALAQSGMSDAAKQLNSQNSAQASLNAAENAQQQQAIGTAVGSAVSIGTTVVAAIA